MDLFDPRFWPEEIGWASITLSSDGSVFAIVDTELEPWLREMGPWSLYERGGKQYARRTRRKGEWQVGGRGATIYMHQLIARKQLGPPPSRDHILVDHINGIGLDNRTMMKGRRKSNLVWATPQQNRLNLWGMNWHQRDFIKDMEESEAMRERMERRMERNGKAR